MPVSANATPNSHASAPLNPLAEMVLSRLQAADGEWVMVESVPIIETLRGLRWLQCSDVRGLIGRGRVPAVECRILPAGRAALAARKIG